MTIFTAEQLDLSRLPAFTLVPVDFAAEKAALVAGIVARFRARGVPFDVEALETDSAVILAEEFAYRKILTLGQINDAGRRLTLTYSDGAYLDHIAATYYADVGLRRLALVDAPRPFATSPEDWESDARFSLRISLAPEARTPGTLGGYEYQALTAAPHLEDALALNHSSGLVRPGQVLVVLLGRDPDPNPQTAIPDQEEPAQAALASTALQNREIKLATDEVLVRVAGRVRVAREYRLGLRRGPDPAAILSEAMRLHGLYVRGRRRIGKALALSGEQAALTVSGVEYVRARDGQMGDIDPGPDAIIDVTGLTLVSEVIGG